jgi:hypothetical protein
MDHNSTVPFIGSLSKGWMARHLELSFDRDYYFDPEVRHEVDTRCNNYAVRELADLDIIYTESNLGQRNHMDANQVLVGGIQPNMLLGMLVGAEFMPHNSMDADISMTPLKDIDPERLPPPNGLIDHELIALFDRQIKQLKAAGRLQPIPPFFWDTSGQATTHGTLTTAQKFLGEDIFIALMMDPDKVIAVMDWITESFIALMKHFSEVGDIAIQSVHIGECSGCMVNVEMFEDVVLPHAGRFAEQLGPLRLHSCGNSTHLLESMKKLPRLAALDLGGDTSMAKVRELFGADFPVDIAPMPADLSAESPEPLLNWAKGIIDENAGGNMRIIYHLEPSYRIENVRALNGYLTGELNSPG